MSFPSSTAPTSKVRARTRVCRCGGGAGEGVGDRGSRAGGSAAVVVVAVAEATRLEAEGRRAHSRCGRVRWAGRGLREGGRAAAGPAFRSCSQLWVGGRGGVIWGREAGGGGGGRRTMSRGMGLL